MNSSQLVTLAANMVGAVQRQLPPDIRPLARGVAIHYESRPAAEVIAEGFAPDILGLFAGDSYAAGTSYDNPMPPQILLYLDNLWDFADRDVGVFRDEVRTTYLHELGHYLGWNEDDLTARGLD